MKAPNIIAHTATIVDALRRLNNLPGGELTLFVVDDDGRLVGTLTDGDIRRALLAEPDLTMSVSAACHKNFRSVSEDKLDPALLREYRAQGITQVPVLDSSRRLVRIINLIEVRTVLPLRALLMAGGKGERLRPATQNTPKPLLQIEGKALIDYNVEALAACGITDINVATGYLAEQIEQHFASPRGDVKVTCRREEKPLGTIGAAAFLSPAKATTDTLVMNSDLITTISFEEMYLHHRDLGADITIAAVPYQVSVPYAILTTDSTNPNKVSAIEEKPAYSYYANAGIYIFRDSVLAGLVPGERCDATDLIERTINAGGLVTYYPIKGTWIDVGSPVDFRQAAELMRHHRNMTE
ncbi:MAG: NTP transferase domain-containing protein [Muribaculaceae bacterium]|nr:NTP transferase domain-containing protein [Muribaculaceae bacterium]